MESQYSCPNCKSKEGFMLMADYSASGLWCKSCGISFGSPEETFSNLPVGLVDLTFAWVAYWEQFCDEATKYNYKFLHNIYCRAGEYLAGLISEFYPCVFEDRN